MDGWMLVYCICCVDVDIDVPCSFPIRRHQSMFINTINMVQARDAFSQCLPTAFTLHSN